MLEHGCQSIFTNSDPMTSSFKQIGEIFLGVYNNILMSFLFPIKLQPFLMKKTESNDELLSIHNGQAGRP